MDDEDMLQALTPQERDNALADLPGWTFDEKKGALYRSIQFASFSEAFGMMTSIAIEAEKLGHHPEWFNVYNRLQIWLTTHDVGNTVSRLDVGLARTVNRLIR